MKKIMIAALICAMTSLAGCDKLKDATSRDIKANKVTFKFEAPTSSNAAATLTAVVTRAGTDNTFTITRTVLLSEIGSSDLEEYRNKISKVAANNSLLSITTTPSGSYSVADVTVKTVGVDGELLVPSYTLGGAFTPPANMNTYTGQFVTRLVNTGSVTITISGKTDAPAGTTINISYETNLVFTASLL